MRRTWAFFESLKIGVSFTTTDCFLFVKVSDIHGRAVDGSLHEFAPNKIVFLVTKGK